MLLKICLKYVLFCWKFGIYLSINLFTFFNFFYLKIENKSGKNPRRSLLIIFFEEHFNQTILIFTIFFQEQFFILF